jgi:hypothetical protein
LEAAGLNLGVEVKVVESVAVVQAHEGGERPDWVIHEGDANEARKKKKKEGGKGRSERSWQWKSDMKVPIGPIGQRRSINYLAIHVRIIVGFGDASMA